ncbi:hypothetical protein ACWEVP_37385 [Amycolatopsis sp. NPDC003865]
MSQDTATTAGPSAAGTRVSKAHVNIAAHQVQANAQGVQHDFAEKPRRRGDGVAGEVLHPGSRQSQEAQIPEFVDSAVKHAAKEDFKLKQWIRVPSSKDADQPPYGMIKDEVA